MTVDYNDKIHVTRFDEATGEGKTGALSRAELIGVNFVNSPADLPPADLDGVIQLGDNETYYFNTTVDLEGNRLVAGQNTVILGSSSENCRIKSTGLTGTALLSSAWSLPMRGITLEADVAINLDATGNANQAIDWFGVNFTDCNTIGTIKNYGNCIWSDCAILNSQGLTFDGSIGTIGLQSSLFDCSSGGTVLILPATLTIPRRFRIIYSAFVAIGAFSETSINVDVGATIPDEGYILDTCNFAAGGTYTAGIQSTDSRVLWTNCVGITNTDSVASYYMVNNATVTDIVTQNVAVKAAGTTSSGPLVQRFTLTANRATYQGPRTRIFQVSGVATLSGGGSNNEYDVLVYLNGAPITGADQAVTSSTGGRVESLTVQTLVQLSTNDYIEIWVKNATGTNDVTFQNLNVIVKAVS